MSTLYHFRVQSQILFVGAKLALNQIHKKNLPANNWKAVIMRHTLHHQVIVQCLYMACKNISMLTILRGCGHNTVEPRIHSGRHAN